MSGSVRWHSIIGTQVTTIVGEASDGIVPVSSARLAGACSERFVSARQGMVNKIDESVDELTRIHREHVLTSTIHSDSQSMVRQATHL